MAPLDTAGWAHNGSGELMNGEPRSQGGADHFMYSQALQGGDVWRMRVEVGRRAWVGFATEQCNVEKNEETAKSTAWVYLYDGMTIIRSDISEDGEQHVHHDLLKDYIPKTLPYDLALRINKDGNVPQIQFDDDAVWHDFAPDRAAPKPGPWFPFLQLDEGDRLSDHCVHRPKPTKSAGKTMHKLSYHNIGLTYSSQSTCSQL